MNKQPAVYDEEMQYLQSIGGSVRGMALAPGKASSDPDVRQEIAECLRALRTGEFKPAERFNDSQRRLQMNPGTYVIVALFGLNYRGRVVRTIQELGGNWLYDVQYADDKGELRRGEFTEDELEPQP